MTASLYNLGSNHDHRLISHQILHHLQHRRDKTWRKFKIAMLILKANLLHSEGELKQSGQK
eukprot:2006749-Pyramimonas_sp.AAC.1